VALRATNLIETAKSRKMPTEVSVDTNLREKGTAMAYFDSKKDCEVMKRFVFPVEELNKR
jgi:hypothetical protein